VERRLFTVEEANALIPKLEIIMGRLQRQGAELLRSIEDLAAETGRTAAQLTTNEIVSLKPGLGSVIDEIEQLVAEIEDCGGEFKGLDLGLVDFPMEMNGEVVLLCWQFGEKEIGYWHTLDDGFAGRQALPLHRPRGHYLQ
jgi:hypothetical protein